MAFTDSIEIAGRTPDKGVYGNVDGGFPLVVFNSAMDTLYCSGAVSSHNLHVCMPTSTTTKTIRPKIG